ncbi:MAG: glycosyltransferase family 4 protein [Acidobacteria bacterium]|nr:glycosyltransferase family 4 protein [Acidobacteriota bacterium]
MSGILRVGIDGRAFASPAAGVRRYIKGLTRALVALGEPLELVALGGLDPTALPPGIGHVAEPPHPPTNLGWTLVGLPRAARRAGVDVVHAPAYTAPFWSPAPVVLTIHDVSYERHPEWYPYRRDWARRAFYRRSAHVASQILTVSRFSATEITAAYGIPADRMTVTPLGVDGAFVAKDPRSRGPLPPGVRQPYLLHVGDLHERRNLAMLIRAVVAARRQMPSAKSLSLVLVGTDLSVGDAVSEIARQAGTPDAVVRLRSVNERRLRGLYQDAVALAYPSFYEGFGLPLVEAMACGTPVLASNVASMPEVLGGAGVLIDPADEAAWTRAILDLLNGGDLRGRLRDAGLRRAGEFTWERTARLTLDVYRRSVAR